METDTSESCGKDWQHHMGSWKHHVCCHGSGGAMYALGFIGALYYYLTTATTVWAGIVGIVKAILWPAFLVYGVFGFLGL
jgi:hypothetical protein